MPKRKANPAPIIADLMGFPPLKPIEGQSMTRYGRQSIASYGRRALVGQYTRPYTRAVELDTVTRISKGRKRRHEHHNETKGQLDYSEAINARR